MPGIRVERLPVRTMGLGLLGFDHLQIVCRSDFQDPGRPVRQDDWFVIEGLREADGAGVRLGVEGWHGGTTLSEANANLRDDALALKIGTPESRGGRDIVEGSAAIELWASLASFATDIELQRFPYIALALPGSALPTLNSSSLIASLLHHTGIDVEAALPAGVRFSPGTSTLLGTSRDDKLRTGNGFTALLGGKGADDLSGNDISGQIDKLYGGRGDDTFHWSAGLNIVHGGQPGLVYDEDGRDTIVYTGAGDVTLEATFAREPHYQPDFIATYRAGQDHLLSIEEVVWDGTGDRLTIGKGVGLSPSPLKVEFNRNGGAGGGGVLDLSHSDVGFRITAHADAELHLDGRTGDRAGSGGLRVSGAERMIASPHEDRFVIASPGASLVISDAAPEDRLAVTWTPSHMAAAYDVRSRELVVHLFPSEAHQRSSLVRLLNFKDGALGIDLDRPLALADEADGALLVSGPLPAQDDAYDLSAPILMADPSLDFLSASIFCLDTFDDVLCHDYPIFGAGDAISALQNAG